MRIKILNVFVIVSSLFAYLEWGGGHESFLFESEWMVIGKLLSDPGSVLHPFIILPLTGQVLLVITLFQQFPSKKLIIAGTIMLGILLGFIFIVGVVSGRISIIVSTIPFLIFSALLLKEVIKR
ncbi:MAG: hypothetical protein IPN79_02495 [Saprospiraceae bacterium]|nr:hypothetical protein [Saprospiraceae bacterium]